MTASKKSTGAKKTVRQKKNAPTVPAPIAAMPTPDHPAYNTAARFWLWLAVGSIASMIAVLWGLAFELRLSAFHWSDTPEGKLVENTQTGWQAAMADTNGQQSSLQAVQKQLGNLAAQLKVAAASSTVTASSSAAAGSTGPRPHLYRPAAVTSSHF